MRFLICILAALVVVGNATASGRQETPSQGGYGVTSRDGKTRYVVLGDGTNSVVAAVQTRGGRVESSPLEGSWGIPSVTLGGAAGGLSHDGATLVVANVEPSNVGSTFVVLSTQPLTPQLIVDLRGSFAFDALSPDGRTLYLIEHTTPDLSHYRVRAYDLAVHRLLPNAIADKRQAGWNMSGYSVARATSADARWVYTLYRNDGGYPFVHALDSVHRTAVCIGLPWLQGESQDALTRASLQLRDQKLTFAVAKRARFVLDARTYVVSKPKPPRGVAAEIVVPAASAVVVAVLALGAVLMSRRGRRLTRSRPRPRG